MTTESPDFPSSKKRQPFSPHSSKLDNRSALPRCACTGGLHLGQLLGAVAFAGFAAHGDHGRVLPKESDVVLFTARVLL
ncbi:hypothetical protein [Nocardia sp. NPDC003183]